ncbi:hypothetical protein QWZ08_18070 [Ferruginibacter paludis]|uniref:hypothetical protein n=1 Tax=Ferruginibacter paludis TaxID=1310417 RepID=UPI0025B28D26|nr:hypothetical protein [Ferruginibacter paludis]MDN3657564.1 hypothetical protein [Ferruginibacter paludis]
MAAIFSFLLFGAINVAAQKSVYDVIPGSGPKKSKPTNNTASLPNIIRGEDRRNDERRDDDRVYTRRSRRTNLPPGQAKKIYGGSATDYAPGQVKKREHDHGNRGGKKGPHGKH